jgi:drug/metabolite transporter (DMT)-like permease
LNQTSCAAHAWLVGLPACGRHAKWGVPFGIPLCTQETAYVPAFLRSQAAAYVLLPLSASCWAGNHIFARAVGGYAPAASLSLARWLIVILVLGLVATPRVFRDRRALKEHLGVLAFLGIVGGGIFGTLQYVILQYTTALNMGVVGSVAPAFIVAASWLLFRERLGPLQLFGVLVSLMGVLAIVSQLQPERLTGLTFNGGDLMIIANMGLWAVYSSCLKLRPDIHPMSFLMALAVFAALVNVPFAAWEYASGRQLQWDALTSSAVLYAAFVSTLLAYIAWNRGIELIGAPRASAFLHTTPIFSALLATTILGESLRLFHVVGFLLILGGVSLASRPGRARSAARVAT